eukprot:jgi/Botrbrau1/3064/Bobra.0070s0057.1
MRNTWRYPRITTKQDRCGMQSHFEPCIPIPTRAGLLGVAASSGELLNYKLSALRLVRSPFRDQQIRDKLACGADMRIYTLIYPEGKGSLVALCGGRLSALNKTFLRGVVISAPKRPSVLRAQDSEREVVHEKSNLDEFDFYPRLSRRFYLCMLAVALCTDRLASSAVAEQGLTRYIRKRKLDPLDTYVPTVLRAKMQLIEAGTIMESDPTKARLLLRQGAFTGLRDSIKAMGEYASQSGLESTLAAKMVSDFFSAVEGLDFALFDAIRNNQPLPSTAASSLDKAILALDRLVATVPGPLLEKSRRVAESAYHSVNQEQPLSASGDGQEGGPDGILPPFRADLLPQVPVQ